MSDYAGHNAEPVPQSLSSHMLVEQQAQIAALTAKLERVRDRLEHIDLRPWNDCHCEVCELKARLARAKEIAMKMRHRMPCIRLYPQIEGECSCGLDDLWREVSL